MRRGRATGPVVVGLDVATAHVRAVAVDAEDGAVLASASGDLPTPVDTPDGGRRQDAAYAQVALAVLGRLADALGRDAGAVRAVATTATSGTVVPCAADGSALGPALLYNDRSTAAEEAHLRAAGTGDRPIAALARMGRLHRDAPAARYGSPADVVAAALVGGPVAADTSHHLKAGIDPVARAWPAEAAVLGLPGDALPPLVRPGEVLGEVAATLARRLGFAAGVVVVAGMTDGCTAQIATGAVGTGDSVGVLGTTLVLKAVADQRVEDAATGVYSHLAPDGRHWPGGASNTGAGVLADGRDLAALDAAVAALDPGTLRRIAPVYPLTGRGERFPFADPGFAGLPGAAAGPVPAHAAVLLGVAHVERLALDVMRRAGVHPVRHLVAGGAARSDVWNALRAAVLPVPVLRPVRQDSAFGAAVLAAAGGGAGPFDEVVARLAGAPVPVAPHPAVDAAEEDHAEFLARLRAAGAAV
jgi:sugar (pentulose or hexulose) kinase